MLTNGEKETHNLRSVKSAGVQISIQLQLSEDNKILPESDLDCSGLMESPDNNYPSIHASSFDLLKVDGPSTSTTKVPIVDAQAL